MHHTSLLLKPPVLPDLNEQAGWLRLNMGAIHLAQGDAAAAARQFRMALDLTPPAYRRLRLNAQRNIGLALVAAGKYGEAADAFAAVMQVGGWAACGLVACGWAEEEGRHRSSASVAGLSCCRPAVAAPPLAPPQDGPDHQTAFNLVLCAVALGDAELMRQAFVQLLQVGS